MKINVKLLAYYRKSYIQKLREVANMRSFFQGFILM